MLHAIVHHLTPFVVLMCSLPMLASTALQLYLAFNPPIATVTLVPRSQTITLSGMLQLGRLLHPITISQSQTTLTTGNDHQDARAATGAITFYNGLFRSQTLLFWLIQLGPTGSLLDNRKGTQVIYFGQCKWDPLACFFCSPKSLTFHRWKV